MAEQKNLSPSLTIYMTLIRYAHRQSVVAAALPTKSTQLFHLLVSRNWNRLLVVIVVPSNLNHLHVIKNS